MRKSYRVTEGIKCTTSFYDNKRKVSKKSTPAEKQEEIDKCLNCTKPIEKCKGNCWE